ncbi:pentatricopeptide repeat-containing protein At2g32630 isoform X2 [Syzygium oleosum]|uniref:pentatricopeptide repeat-containing protein At2g32630 isoform X2 n=1 Tax=Syzygium oleosum TaxID=219896 RepID=UPI0024B91BBA|nr:pentatricopeptide repeat-containing protein At2g32630 isoform X2 [Syzygium oleosum]
MLIFFFFCHFLQSFDESLFRECWSMEPVAVVVTVACFSLYRYFGRPPSCLPLISRRTIDSLSRLNHARTLSRIACSQRSVFCVHSRVSPPRREPCGGGKNASFNDPKRPGFSVTFGRSIHALQEANVIDSEDDDGTMNEYLSRFVWIMRGKLDEAYPDSDKQTVNGMLLIIVENVVAEMEKGGLQSKTSGDATLPSQDFSEDLWKTVWEVSNKVLEDMEKERKKEKMKGFMQDEEVKEMCRFAAEVGIRGDMLRELRFKWAQEKMEEKEFYRSLEHLREEALKEEKEDAGDSDKAEAIGVDIAVGDGKPKVVSLPKRRGKFNYKIYGLDLSDPKWAEVADKIHQSEEITWPRETKPISGKSKLVTEKILSMKDEDDPSPLLAEWVELMQPNRVDWTALLDRLKEQNPRMYLKVAEHLLNEESFQANVRDYSKLIDAYAKDTSLEDAERILEKMYENGIPLDILTATILVQMHCKAGKLDRAQEAFESLTKQGFRPDVKVYNSMIMAYANAGKPEMGEHLIREMEARDMKPSEEIYMALLRSFAQDDNGKVAVDGANRITTTMQFAGFQPSLESCTLLVEAYGQAKDPDTARSNFDYMIKLGHKPDDRCTASMIAAYMKKNYLDKALTLLLQLEKDGFEPGVHTYAVLVDWLGKLQLIDEAEQVLDKIALQGEAPPLKVHISLCDMYSRAGMEKKALQTLGAIEAKKEQLNSHDFERVVNGLIAGGFIQEAQRMRVLMETQGFAPPESLQVALLASQTFGRKRPGLR